MTYPAALTKGAPLQSRRDFLKAACGVAALALGPALLADDAMAADGIRRKKNGQVAVTVASIPGLSKVGGTVNLGTVKGAPVAVVRTGATTYEALNLRCTHQGVTVRQSGSEWVCPAHGSAYSINGALVQGPARTPLATMTSTFNGKRLVIG